MTVNNNSPYVYLDFTGQNLYVASFFAGPNSVYNTPTATARPIPDDPNNSYIDVQIAVQAGTNVNNYDGAMINISTLMNCVFALVTQTNQDTSVVKTKIHLELPIPH
jgi:hypothetical protein